MLLHRRKNIFTLGDFYQKTKPVSQVRTLVRNRQAADVFERDPFKVQSYNFRYAERPVHQPITQYTSCFRSHLQALRESDKLHRSNYGLSNIGSNEKSIKADKFLDIQRYKCAAPEVRPSTTRVFCRPSENRADARQQQQQQQQQQQRSDDALSRGNESYARTIAKLSAHDSSERRANEAAEARSIRPAGLSSTYKKQPSTSGEYSHIQRSSNPCIFQNGSRMANFNAAARAKLYARETSKAMAAAVGTVGCPSIRSSSPIAATRKPSRQSVTKKPERVFYDSDTHPFGCRRSIADTEIGSYNSINRSSSISMLRKTNANHNNNQPMQNGYTLGTRRCLNDRQTQQCLQKPIVRNLVTNNAPPSPRQSRQINDILITIKNAQPQNTTNDNVVIKIESSAPVNITRSITTVNTPTNNGRNEPDTKNNNRWNNLTIQKTKTHTPPIRCNITSQSSTNEFNLNRSQSKYSLSEDNNNLYQRARACERFFEREEKRLREMTTKASKFKNGGYVLGRRPSKEFIAKLTPTSQLTQQGTQNSSNDLSSTAIKARRLQSIYENGLNSLRQLRASIGVPQRNVTASRPCSPSPSNQSQLSTKDDVSKKNSSATFTLYRPGRLRAPAGRPQRSISQMSIQNTISNQSIRSQATRISSTSSCVGDKSKPPSPRNVNYNLFSGRQNKAA